jgi:sodium/hydrogen antiporter
MFPALPPAHFWLCLGDFPRLVRNRSSSIPECDRSSQVSGGRSNVGKYVVDIAALSLVLAAIFAWGMVSARAAAISTPIFFVAIGLIMAEGLKLVDLEPDPHSTKIIAEVTLVWVLFADASRVRFAELREDLGHYVRLLAIGLPLTIGLGTLTAISVLNVSPWYALLLGAALAPTDAALGSAVMSDRRVPYRVRQTLNVESGLNDGIATPVVTVVLAAIAAEAGVAHEGPAHALLGLLLGALTGIVLGALGGLLLRAARQRGWSSEEFAGPSVLALALLAYVVALLIDANGFVAAFVAGSAFGAVTARGEEKEVYYVEQTCGLASMISWLLFGALAVPDIAADWSWGIVLYAVLSLTVIRMVPVAISLLGARMDWSTVFFIGWFGPRGLASIVFALIALEELQGVPGPLEEIVATISLTVLLSVLLHGLSAQPLAGRYAATHQAEVEPVERPEPTLRRLVSPSRKRS